MGGVIWTPQQRQEMQAYWKKHYGENISDRWHKLYQSMNGTYCKDYFPEMLYTTRLEPRINPDAYCRLFNDKSLIETLYRAADAEYRMPHTYLACCHGTLCDGSRNLLTQQAALRLMHDVGECVIKPTVETGSGKGVAVLNLRDGQDVRTGNSLEAILKGYGDAYIIQEKLKNSERIAAINASSLNTIRLITYIIEDQVKNVPPVLRLGVDGNEVDNIHKGGLCIGVRDDGCLLKTAWQLGYGDTATQFKQHPDSGIVFDGYYIGDIAKVIEVGKALHRMTPHVGMISWDLTLDHHDEVVLIEATASRRACGSPRLSTGSPCSARIPPTC